MKSALHIGRTFGLVAGATLLLISCAGGAVDRSSWNTHKVRLGITRVTSAHGFGPHGYLPLMGSEQDCIEAKIPTTDEARAALNKCAVTLGGTDAYRRPGAALRTQELKKITAQCMQNNGVPVIENEISIEFRTCSL